MLLYSDNEIESDGLLLGKVAGTFPDFERYYLLAERDGNFVLVRTLKMLFLVKGICLILKTFPVNAS